MVDAKTAIYDDQVAGNRTTVVNLPYGGARRALTFLITVVEARDLIPLRLTETDSWHASPHACRN